MAGPFGTPPLDAVLCTPSCCRGGWHCQCPGAAASPNASPTLITAQWRCSPHWSSFTLPFPRVEGQTIRPYLPGPAQSKNKQEFPLGGHPACLFSAYFHCLLTLLINIACEDWPFLGRCCVTQPGRPSTPVWKPGESPHFWHFDSSLSLFKLPSFVLFMEWVRGTGHAIKGLSSSLPLLPINKS